MQLSEPVQKKIRALCAYNNVSQDLFDWPAYWDGELGDEENLENLRTQFHLKDVNWEKTQIYEGQVEKEIEQYHSWHDKYGDGLNVLEDESIATIGILGGPRQGKTTLAHVVCDKLRLFRKLPVFTYKYPQGKLKLLEPIAYKNLIDFGQLNRLHDAIVWLDEPQVSLPSGSKESNRYLIQLLSIAAQNNLVLVFSTSDTRWVNKSLEAYINVWLIKDIWAQGIKQGSIIKYIIKDYQPIDPDSFRLNKNEYLLQYRGTEDYHGKYTFEPPKYWTPEYSLTHKKGDTQ